ncbi:MAG: enoyl-CoA hydratase/isomerase family protein [Gammaproteobacteria bacterium]|nr:enoyl-CoA hydratase/isomerase family protein [Gammaproteobacteria bacterium]
MTEQTYKNWRLERDDHDTIWLYADKANATTNVLSADVLMELDAIISAIEQERPQGLVILSAKASGFIAGADINEFTTLNGQQDAEALIGRGQAVLDRLEALDMPTVALIHGFCLGGGMELALACRYRVADDDPGTKLGLPEVNLGIHPGFGGTVRLPPLVGAPAAMDMMLSGRSVNAKAAQRMGLVDYAVPQRRLRDAAKHLVLKSPQQKKATGWKALTNHDLVRPLLARYLRKQVAQRARKDHYPAPYAVIDLWAQYMGNPRRMMKEEAASVARLVMGDTAQNLIRVFFLQERLKSLGRKSDIAPKHVHVIGGGVMGGDIAAWCAMRGFKVTIQDRNPETIGRVVKRAYDLYKKRLKQPRAIQAALDRLIPDIKGVGIPKADVVIEAIFENVEAKQSLYRMVEPQLKSGALLATNTSSIPLEVLSLVLARPERLVGLHFFNPVAKMQLVEIVKSEHTDPQVVRQATAFCRHIDRLPLPVKSAPGFLVNRVLMPYLLEAVTLVEEGISAPLIDQAALDFGMPMGPIELADTVGLDICLSVAKILGEQLQLPVPGRLQQMVDVGRLGRKSGEGFYRYINGKKQAQAVDKGAHLPADVTDRMMMRFINEAMACLREGIVEDKDLLDAGVIFGTGFAPFRGGPMNYVEHKGVGELKGCLRGLEQRHGRRFRPDPGWG